MLDPPTLLGGAVEMDLFFPPDLLIFLDYIDCLSIEWAVAANESQSGESSLANLRTVSSAHA